MGHSIQLNFFATREDMLPGILAFESTHKIKYCLGGLFECPKTEVFSTVLEIPMFGTARFGNRVAEDVFLITPEETDLVMKTIPQRRGPAKYAIDSRNVPGFAFSAGGVFDSEFVIDGTVGLVDGSQDSFLSCKAFVRSLRKDWLKVQSYSVGPRAFELMNQGYRLANSIRSPKSDDLRL